MADGITFQLIGEKRWIDKLNRLERVDARRAIRRGTRAGAKVMLPAAKRLAPKRTGLLRRAIRVRATKRSRRYIGAVVRMGEGYFKGKTFYGGFQEWGWKTGKRGSPNRRQVEGVHFMERAAEAKGQQAAEAAEAVIVSEIEAAAAR